MSVAGQMNKTLSEGTDLDNIKTNGMYFLKKGTNAPSDYFFFIVLQNNATGDLTQFGFVMRASINMYIRNCFNGAWTPWNSVNINA